MTDPVRGPEPPTGRISRGVAVTVWVVTVSLGAATVALAVRNGVSATQFFTQFTAALVLSSLSTVTMGTLIVLRRPRNVIGWLLCSGALGAVAATVGQYARLGLVTDPGRLPAAETAAWLNLWIWLPGLVALMVLVPLLFPNGRPPSRRWWGVAWLAGLALLTGVVHRAVAPAADPGLPEVPNPYGIRGLEPFLSGLEITWSSALVVSIVGAVSSLFVRFRRASYEHRQQLKWVFGAAGLLVLAEVVTPLVSLALLGRVDPLTVAIAETVATPWMAVAVGIAILRHQLYDIDALIGRGLVYLMLTAVVVGTYVVVVGYFGTALDLRGEPVSLLAAAVVAVIFAPVRTRLQHLVNRWVYGHRDEPYAVLAELGRRLEATLDLDNVLMTVVNMVREALKLPHAEIVLSSTGQRVTSGQPAGTPVRLPLLFGNEHVGDLTLSPRSPGDSFGPADHRLLDDFARHAAVAAHAVSLNADLRRAHTRLLNAREEERRRLRRDLHDGLGPQLASQTLALDAARQLVHTDPEAAQAMLVDLREQTVDAVRELRALIQNLRPPVLDDRGLGAALREEAERFAHPELSVAVVVPDEFPALPAAVDVAIYRIALEALTNVARHAGASRCEIALDVDDDEIVLRVRDDGRGLRPETELGVGWASMRARANELGGTVSIGSNGLTVLTARVPLGEDD